MCDTSAEQRRTEYQRELQRGKIQYHISEAMDAGEHGCDQGVEYAIAALAHSHDGNDIIFDFSSNRRIDFAMFAVPLIMEELKRHSCLDGKVAFLLPPSVYRAIIKEYRLKVKQ